MHTQGVILNDCSDMDMRSASSSFKTEASTSPSVGKRSLNSFMVVEKDDDDQPLECPMSVEESGVVDVDNDNGGTEINAPSDEEGEVERKNKVQGEQQQTWELKDGMVQVKVTRARSSSMTEENDNNAPEADKHPTFEHARLKWDTATAQLTKRRVDRLGPQSWHGKRRLQDTAPLKTRSVPRNSLRTTNTTTSSATQEANSTEMTETRTGQPAESASNETKSLSPPRSTQEGNVETSSGNSVKATDADDQSISMPTPATARSKFAAMSESANFESSTTSFLAELPKMPRRWKIDDDGSVASSVVRGGRVYKIQGPSTTKRYSYSTGPSKGTPRQSLPASNSIASRTLVTAGTSSESSDDDDITEYDTVVPLNDRDRRGSVERSESGSSFTPSIATFADFDVHYPLETVPSAGSQSDQKESGGNPASVESGQERSEFIPLNDTESYRKANGQELHEDEEEEEEEEEEQELGDYEEDLQDAEPVEDNRFVVDKVPAKKRWTSKNIHNFPVWPPIIKVQTWDKKNVSAVSIGSGFSFDESFTNSNAVVSSLGDDDISYEEEEFVRRPPEHRTSYRIRYDGPTSLKLEDIYKDSDGRFESTKKPADGLPTMPSRRVTDSAPSAPPRITTSSDTDDISVSLSAAIEENKRPDVWITPVSGSLPTEPIWKVRRVWAVEDEDEKEQDHAVGNHELLEKIKSLVGARDGPSGNVMDNAPQLPQRSWHVRTIVEKRGRLENVEAEKSLDVAELQENIKVMAEEAVKEIASNQKVFEEYKKKRELQKAEEELMQDLPQVESFEEIDDVTTNTTGAQGEAMSVPIDHAGEIGSVKADDVDESTSINAKDVEVAAIPIVEEVDRANADNADVDEPNLLASGTIDAISDTAPDVADSFADDETTSRAAEDVIPTTTTAIHVDPELQPNFTSDAMDASQEDRAEAKCSTNDKAEPVTLVGLEDDDETVMETESVVPTATTDVSEKKITKRKKRRDNSPKSSPKLNKDGVGDESADAPSTPVPTKQKRRSSTAAASMASPSITATPKKSKSKSKSSDPSSLMSPKRASKSSKEVLTTSIDSPVQTISTEINMDTSKLMTPKTPKSKTKAPSPKPKSPKRDKPKTDTLRKGKKSTSEKEKEGETPQIKKKVIPLAQLVRNGTDSSDNDDDDSAVESVGIQSARGESRFVSNKVTATKMSSPEPRNTARLSLAAMVHDTDSENEDSGSDDEHYTAASNGPRIVQPATTKSPRRGPGWWNTPGGTKRRSIPLKGTTGRPISPPLEKSNQSTVDSD